MCIRDRDSIALLGDVSVILRACPTHLPRKTDFRLRTVKDLSLIHIL